jgi:hypothetical protein
MPNAQSAQIPQSKLASLNGREKTEKKRRKKRGIDKKKERGSNSSPAII